MAGRSRALTIQEIRGIIRRHPEEFSGIVAVTASTKEEAAGKIADFVLSHNSVVNSIVAAGLEIDVEAAARLGMFGCVAAANRRRSDHTRHTRSRRRAHNADSPIRLLAASNPLRIMRTNIEHRASDSCDGAMNMPQEKFGRWLIAQRDRGDWVDDLATAARSDRAFPKDGDPEAVRAYLRGQQADGDVFAAVDDAEVDWLAY